MLVRGAQAVGRSSSASFALKVNSYHLDDCRGVSIFREVEGEDVVTWQAQCIMHRRSRGRCLHERPVSLKPSRTSVGKTRHGTCTDSSPADVSHIGSAAGEVGVEHAAVGILLEHMLTRKTPPQQRQKKSVAREVEQRKVLTIGSIQYPSSGEINMPDRRARRKAQQRLS